MYLMEWEKDVIVMEDLNISIKPPYQKENVEGKIKKSVTMVQKMVPHTKYLLFILLKDR